MLVAANAVVVVGLWWRQGGIREVHDLAGLLDEPRARHGPARRLPGAGRAPAAGAHPRARRGCGIERMRGWHRRNGVACLALLVAHTRAHHGRLRARRRRLAERRDGRPAHALLGRAAGHHGLGLLVGRRRQLGRWSSAAGSRYERVARVHVSAYLAIALAFSHQLATGREFQGQPVARAYWWALYAVALGRSSALRLGCPVARSLRHRLRVERVVARGAGRSSRWRSAASGSSGSRCARASCCTGASWRAGTGGRRTRSRCRPRPTAGGCASRSRTSATTRAGWRRCRPGRA